MLERFVHVVDDDPSDRDALCFLLSSHGIESESYSCGRDLLSHGELNRGVILLDLNMYELSGLDVLEKLRERGCSLPAILTSGDGNISAAVEGMKRGATHFLEKPYAPVPLIACLEHAFTIRALNAEESSTNAAARRKVQDLSPRQREILQGMVAGESNKVMARRLGLSPRTVETHRSHMLDRLGVSNISDAIRVANQAGLGAPRCEDDERIEPKSAPITRTSTAQLELKLQ